MSVRLRRLQSDYEQIQARLHASKFITVRNVTGDPPERYEIEYRVRSLVLQNDGQIVESAPHVAEIILTRAYPHRAPHCKMLTPIFHPNIDPGAICIGDHWAASESLSDLIVRIGQMIAYQTYNTKSPLNGEAARWADEHKDLLPVDPTDLIPAEMENTPAIVPPPSTPQAKTIHCQNCGTPSSQQTLVRCIGGHLACPDCVVHCSHCGGTLCLLCESVVCSVCNKKGCARCLKTCADCGKAACVEHFVRCAQCGKESCATCAGSCATCGKSFCKTHIPPLQELLPTAMRKLRRYMRDLSARLCAPQERNRPMRKLQGMGLSESSARFSGLRPENMRRLWHCLRCMREMGDPCRDRGLRHLQKGGLCRLREGMPRLQEKGLPISRGNLRAAPRSRCVLQLHDHLPHMPQTGVQDAEPRDALLGLQAPGLPRMREDLCGLRRTCLRGTHISLPDLQDRCM